MTPARKKKLLSIFNELYPDPESELNFKNDYELLVSVILSAQCTDKKVNQTTPALFKAYPDFKKLSKAREAAVAEIIRPINYYKTKAKHLVKMAGLVCQDYEGSLPDTLKELRLLPGVGQKTASVIQSERGIEHAFPVDTHVYRVARRLELSSSETPAGVEKDLMKAFDSSNWRNLHHWLIFHGRRVCKARRPLCEGCPITFCPSRREA